VLFSYNVRNVHRHAGLGKAIVGLESEPAVRFVVKVLAGGEERGLLARNYDPCAIGGSNPRYAKPARRAGTSRSNARRRGTLPVHTDINWIVNGAAKPQPCKGNACLSSSELPRPAQVGLVPLRGGGECRDDSSMIRLDFAGAREAGRASAFLNSVIEEPPTVKCVQLTMSSSRARSQ